jgi:uncharacterized protein YtpQ (UPF0354 family)
MALLRWILFAGLALYCAGASADALTDRVAAAFNHADPKLRPKIKADDEIQLSSPRGSFQVFLDRVRAECQKQPDTCDGTIENLVSATLATVGQPEAMAFDPDNVYPVVRPESTVQAMQASTGGKSKDTFVSRPYISGALLLYVVDAPRAVRFVNSSDLNRAGMTVDALNTLAFTHVSRLPTAHFQKMEEAPGILAAIFNDGYGTSRLFDPIFWDSAEAAAGGPVAIALPTRDWLLAARLDDAKAMARLRKLAGQIVAGESTAVTSALVRRDGQGWSEVPPGR